MRETLERLWREYLWDQCAQIETEEERELTKKASKLHEAANTLLNTEQQAAVEKYVDAFFEMEALFLKKAFFKGCEFAVSFLWEARNLENKKEDEDFFVLFLFLYFPSLLLTRNSGTAAVTPTTVAARKIV